MAERASYRGHNGESFRRTRRSRLRPLPTAEESTDNPAGLPEHIYRPLRDTVLPIILYRLAGKIPVTPELIESVSSDVYNHFANHAAGETQPSSVLLEMMPYLLTAAADLYSTELTSPRTIELRDRIKQKPGFSTVEEFQDTIIEKLLPEKKDRRELLKKAARAENDPALEPTHPHQNPHQRERQTAGQPERQIVVDLSSGSSNTRPELPIDRPKEPHASAVVSPSQIVPRAIERVAHEGQAVKAAKPVAAEVEAPPPNPAVKDTDTLVPSPKPLSDATGGIRQDTIEQNFAPLNTITVASTPHQVIPIHDEIIQEKAKPAPSDIPQSDTKSTPAIETRANTYLPALREVSMHVIFLLQTTKEFTSLPITEGKVYENQQNGTSEPIVTHGTQGGRQATKVPSAEGSSQTTAKILEEDREKAEQEATAVAKELELPPHLQRVFIKVYYASPASPVTLKDFQHLSTYAGLLRKRLEGTGYTVINVNKPKSPKGGAYYIEKPIIEEESEQKRVFSTNEPGRNSQSSEPDKNQAETTKNDQPRRKAQKERRSRGRELSTQEKVFLMYLDTREGEMLSLEEFAQLLWPEEAFDYKKAKMRLKVINRHIISKTGESGIIVHKKGREIIGYSRTTGNAERTSTRGAFYDEEKPANTVHAKTATS